MMSDAEPIKTNEVDQLPNQAQEPTTKPPLSWMEYAINAVVAIIFISCALLSYHHFVVLPNKQRFAYLDIPELLELKQLQVAGAATGPGSTESDRERAFGDIARFAGDLERAVAEIQGECDCTILVRAAVVKSKAEDLTPVLKERLGLAGLTKESLMGAIRGNRLGAELNGGAAK